MNITKENFGQYVDIATDLAQKELYREAFMIGAAAYDAWQEWEDDELPDIEQVAQMLKTLAYTEWRAADNSEGYTMLAENLNNCFYWSDEYIDSNRNFLGVCILNQKALAYCKLAYEWMTDHGYNSMPNMHDLYMDRALRYINEAIERLNELVAEEAESNPKEANDLAEFCLNCKIDLAIIQRHKSNKLARNTAISLFGENLSEDQKETVMEIYQGTTDVLFNDFFAKSWFIDLKLREDGDESVKEDIINYLLEADLEPGNDDPYWWAFTHKNTPEERKKIRFVKNIEDAGDNDFEEIPWVFTLDRYPFDIEFNEGEEPDEDSVYGIDPENPDRYNRI